MYIQVRKISEKNFIIAAVKDRFISRSLPTRHPVNAFSILRVLGVQREKKRKREKRKGAKSYNTIPTGYFYLQWGRLANDNRYNSDNTVINILPIKRSDFRHHHSFPARYFRTSVPYYC